MSSDLLYPAPPVANKVIRFGLETPGGLRSGYWRLWRSGKGDDVYLTARGANHALKVSLHSSGKWRWGWITDFTQEAVKLGFLRSDEDRAQMKWDRPESVDGWAHATTVYFPGREATMPKVGTDKSLTLNLIAPPADHLVAVHVWIAEPEAKVKFPGWRKEHAIVAAIRLPSGAHAVLTAEQTVLTIDQIRAIDEAVLKAATIVPWEAIDVAGPGQMRLSLHLADDDTGAARFIDLDAKTRLEPMRRLVSD